MRLIAQALALASLLAALPAFAVVVEVPVPELAGIYLGEYRTATIHLPAIPSAIYGASVRIKGTTQLAYYSCDGPGGYGPPELVSTTVVVEMIPQAGTWVVERRHDVSGPIDWTEPFVPVFGATWDFLLDGTGDVGLVASGIHPIPECILVGPPSSTTIESVTLLVDGEFPTPAQATSWGRVKAAYR